MKTRDEVNKLIEELEIERDSEYTFHSIKMRNEGAINYLKASENMSKESMLEEIKELKLSTSDYSRGGMEALQWCLY